MARNISTEYDKKKKIKEIMIIKMAEQLSGKCMPFEIPDNVSTVYFFVCRGK